LARRRTSRELVFAVLFQLEHGQEAPFVVLEELAVERRVPAEGVDFARRLLTGIMESKEEIDRAIEESLENWSMRRLASTDRTVLRLAVGELLLVPESPAVVVVDEAVELAGRYGTENSGAFVNGVLDRIARRMRPLELGTDGSTC
jgi:N utilization substance protein B